LSWRSARRIRRLVQLAVFTFFVYLLFAALQRKSAFPLADLFFRFDPLAALATMLAARRWLPHLELALVTVAVTLVLGRVWCGWLCPLGTLLEWFRFRRARQRAKRLPPRLAMTKYVVLVMIVTMAVLGGMTLMIFDPLGLLTRTMTTSVIPAFDYAFTGVEAAMLHVSWLVPRVDWLETHLRGTVLPVIQPLFLQATALFVVFFIVVALNLLADRFWCRYLCPLGALLGLVAKAAVLRPVFAESCGACNRCAAVCPTGAIAAGGTAKRTDAVAARGGAPPDDPGDTAPVLVSSECTVCLDCLVACETDAAMRFGFARPGPWAEYDPGRRQFVGAAAGGVGAAVLLGVGAWKRLPSSYLLRPPGVTGEQTFLAHCLRCTQCMKVCPTSGLQPALNEAGLEGFWTPVLKPRLGYCDYGCTACGHVCPSGAIPRLDLETKRKQVIGVAAIDRDRCLPWSQNTPCIVCQEMCPVPDKAIVLTRGKIVKSPQGFENLVRDPIVVPRLCIGCGICETKCPVQGAAAIVVQTAASFTATPPPALG
jgi:polyferredoxin